MGLEKTVILVILVMVIFTPKLLVLLIIPTIVPKGLGNLPIQAAIVPAITSFTRLETGINTSRNERKIVREVLQMRSRGVHQRRALLRWAALGDDKVVEQHLRKVGNLLM